MNKKQKKILFSIIFCLLALVAVEIAIQYVDFKENINNKVELVLFLVPYLIIGNRVLIKAIKNILRGKIFDENFLMTIATIGAFCLGEYSEGVAVMLFYQIGELFEMYAVNKSRKSISSLLDIRPDYANLLIDGEYKKVDPYDIKVGQPIIILPGERVPLDGVIVEGETYLDTSALTGESVPRRAKIGDVILSGCINTQGAITVRVEKEFDDSTVARILELVEEAGSKKATYENFITRFAKYYTPIVVGLAMLVDFLPPILLGDSFSMWLNRSLIFLVISCPCALVISVPLSFFGGIGAASRNGILVKGSNYLEAIASTDIIVFDKTGTLTKGVFTVDKIIPSNTNITGEKLLELAAYAEAYSNHPIGVSLKNAYKEQEQKAQEQKEQEQKEKEQKEQTHKEIDNSKITDIREISGKGIQVSINDIKLFVGNEKLMKELDLNYFVPSNLSGTIVYLAYEKEYLGCISISDQIKDGVKQAIKDIKKMKISKTVMLTGDRDEVAKEVGERLGIDEVKSQLLPEDKLRYVEEYLEQIKGTKAKLAYVGDGINDAPVLTRADIGIAMGALGQDAAIEAADIVLMDDDPAKIKTAYEIARKTIAIVKQNIIFALGIKVLVMILGVVGIANMWMAVFADVGVSVIAIINAMRALKYKHMKR